MNYLLLARHEAVALLDRLEAAYAREPEYLPFLSAAGAVEHALAQKTLLGTPHRTVEVCLSDTDTSAAMRAAITYGTGREIR